MLGVKGRIDQDAIYVAKESLTSKRITGNYTKNWNKELKRIKPNVLRVLSKEHGAGILFWGIAFAFVETSIRYIFIKMIQFLPKISLGGSFHNFFLKHACRIIQPLCLGGLVSYFVPGQTELTRTDAFYYAAGIITASILTVCTYHPYILYALETGSRLRIGSSGLIYQKV